MVPPIRTRRQGSCQGVAEHFQQCAEFPPLRNRGLGPLVVTVLPIALAGRAAATACAAVQSAAPLFGRWRPAGLVGPPPPKQRLDGSAPEALSDSAKPTTG